MYNDRLGGPLSDAGVVELTNWLTRISLEAAKMGECIFAAENSQIITPAFVMKLWAVQANLGMVGAAVEMYM